MYIISVTDSNGFNITTQTESAYCFTEAGINYLRLNSWDNMLHYIGKQYLAAYSSNKTVYARYGHPRTINDVIKSAARISMYKGIRVLTDDNVELYKGSIKNVPVSLLETIFSKVYKQGGYYVFKVERYMR